MAQASRVRRGDNHANNITQKARTLRTEDADDAFWIDRDACFGSCMCDSNVRFEARYTRHMPLGAAREIVVACRPEKAAEAELSRM